MIKILLTTLVLICLPTNATVTVNSSAAGAGGGGVATSVSATDGAAATPSINFASDPDTGFYWVSANRFSVALGGEDRFQFRTDQFSPATASSTQLGNGTQSWSTLFVGLASMQSGWRVHSTSFGTGLMIGAGGLTAPDGSTFTGIYGEGGATNNIGIVGGVDTTSTAKGVIVQGQNSTDADAGGPIVIRGGASTSGTGGGIKFITPSTKATCNSGNRGMYWHTLGGAGVKDNVEVCAKDAGDAYAWRTIY